MKLNLSKQFIAVALFAVVLVSTAFAQNKIVLWDFRKDDSKTQNFPKAESRAVFKYLFGAKWDEALELSSRVSGSFTKPNANETLYYVGGCQEGEGFRDNTNCGHASWWNDGWIAIYDGTNTVLKVQAALGYEIAKVTDINNDGINEVFALSGYSNMGETITSATFGQIVNGKFVEIKSFTGYSDTCGVEKKSRQFAKASVVSYVPSINGTPTFSQEYFQNRCGKTAWKKITKKQFEAN